MSSHDSALKSVWFWIIGLLVCAIAALAITLWLSYEARFEQNAQVREIVKQETLAAKTPNQNNNAAADNVDPSLPVPAKKLQTLLNDEQEASEADLDERMAALDKQLKALDDELRAQGIDVPQREEVNQAVTDQAVDDTEARLSAIKKFMEERQTPAPTTN